jgi:chemotaxis methyl-accepting protein methylase
MFDRQEAYSVAMALIEFLGEAGIRRDIQVFATDVGDRLALETARAGVYPESIEDRGQSGTPAALLHQREALVPDSEVRP